VLRRQIEIPAKLNNYATRGASVKLDLTFGQRRSAGHQRILQWWAGLSRHRQHAAAQDNHHLRRNSAYRREDARRLAGKAHPPESCLPAERGQPKATYEIPYGTVERPTSRNTPAEQAQFEVPALQWADISDDSHDFSLLNDCKYGNEAKGNALRLSLLRSPEWPDAHADQGDHDFTYSLIPTPGPGARPKPSVAATN